MTTEVVPVRVDERRGDIVERNDDHFGTHRGVDQPSSVGRISAAASAVSRERWPKGNPPRTLLPVLPATVDDAQGVPRPHPDEQVPTVGWAHWLVMIGFLGGFPLFFEAYGQSINPEFHWPVIGNTFGWHLWTRSRHRHRRRHRHAHHHPPAQPPARPSRSSRFSGSRFVPRTRSRPSCSSRAWHGVRQGRQDRHLPPQQPRVGFLHDAGGQASRRPAPRWSLFSH